MGRTTKDFPRFPIGKLFELFGADPPEEDRHWHSVKCPFHEKVTGHADSDASGSVKTTDEHIFRCYSCGTRGNVAQIIMKLEGVGFGDALRRAEEITGTSSGSVRGGSRRGSSVSGEAGNRFSYRAFKATWVREGECDSGAQEGEG